MATKSTTISGALDANESSADTYRMPAGGVLVCDLQRTAGTMTVTLEVSLNDGSNWSSVFNVDGEAESIALDGTTTHGHFEVLAQAGAQYRVTGSNNSSGEVLYKLGQVIVV